MRIALLGDTHFPRRGDRLPDACLAQCRAADVIVHTGDLADVRSLLPATAEVELPGGRRMGLVHNGGAEAGRLARMRTRFPGCDLVAFGHSHIPLMARDGDGFAIVNPGSATDRRRQPRHSMAIIDVAGDGAPDVRFIDLDADGAPLDAALVRDAG